MPTPPLQLYVDDSDPSITYITSEVEYWTRPTGLLTAPQRLISPGRTPWYGTLHQALGPTSLSFMFNGTYIHAVFLGADKSLVNQCLVDGKPQYINTRVGEVFCATTVPDGPHNLTITVRGSSFTPASFDGLFYVPSPSTTISKDVDVTFPLVALNASLTPGSPVELNEGDGVDFDFTGQSIALYSDISTSSLGPLSELSYNIDDEPAVDMGLNSSTLVNTLSPGQLFLQTRQYAYGQHRFRMQLTKHGGYMPFTIDQIIVQNSPTTLNLALEAVPPLQPAITSSRDANSASTAPPSNSASIDIRGPGDRIGRGGIVAMAVLLPLLLLGILLGTIFLIRRSKQRKSYLQIHAYGGNISHDEVRPFIPSILMRTMVPPSSKDVTQSQKHSAGTGTSSITSRTRSQIPTLGSTTSTTTIYRVHEDGGSVAETGTPDQQVIDLPPVYSTLLERLQTSTTGNRT
ncbi:hypothetical protein D9613_010747 [Agrocybe pediades]|uniref:Uncharacterized protein n=1 Tax=Agrocybe pediades TaxID=84607 RepID=A0A8H4QMG5_9AGAR|nr:hypothetical protein D9613_010747 [Agrocybe pediades]